MIYFYRGFIRKLICAGRGDGIKPHFRFDTEIRRDRFIKFANKFIEDYYATVPPDFAATHPMKFCFGVASNDGPLAMRPNMHSREVENHPEINAGILYIRINTGESAEDQPLDGSIFRQACLVQRERLKIWMTVLGLTVAVGALLISVFFKK